MFGNLKQRHYLTSSRVFDIDATSDSNRTPESVLALDKKRMYKQAVEDCRGTFTPFVTSVDGLLQPEAGYMCCKKSYAHMCGYIRARLSFAIIRAASSRVKRRSGGASTMGPLFTRSCIETVRTIYLLTVRLIHVTTWGIKGSAAFDVTVIFQ